MEGGCASQGSHDPPDRRIHSPRPPAARLLLRAPHGRGDPPTSARWSRYVSLGQGQPSLLLADKARLRANSLESGAAAVLGTGGSRPPPPPSPSSTLRGLGVTPASVADSARQVRDQRKATRG
ncbi:hypothetical protein NDU88_002326 [Pleurodeles waltl]|uniref:Uncharacterized protein n=1 Tax=Pleurodeles waltl TaxID=8319 RepID=A0AAV7SDC6_PLEWA|nr:hypothetical protein NDU88_002326 [Pleurodeles waltl]